MDARDFKWPSGVLALFATDPVVVRAARALERLYETGDCNVESLVEEVLYSLNRIKPQNLVTDGFQRMRRRGCGVEEEPGKLIRIPA